MSYALLYNGKLEKVIAFSTGWRPKSDLPIRRVITRLSHDRRLNKMWYSLLDYIKYFVSYLFYNTLNALFLAVFVLAEKDYQGRINFEAMHSALDEESKFSTSYTFEDFCFVWLGFTHTLP